MRVNQLDGLRRYLEAATTLTQITRGRAEELVRDLVASGELERTRAQDWIEDLMRRSREASEMLVAAISSEVDRQLGDRGLKDLDVDDLAQRVAGIIGLAGSVGRNVTVPRVWSRGRDEGHAHPHATTNGQKTSDRKKSGQKKSDEKKSGGKGSGKKKDGSKSSAKLGNKGPGSKKEGAGSKGSGSKKEKERSEKVRSADPEKSHPAGDTGGHPDIGAST